MVVLEATIERDGEAASIAIRGDELDVLIPLTEEKPEEVKQAFNQILEQVRESDVRIEYDKVDADLFAHVTEEYVTQLNREIAAVRQEMLRLGFASPATDPDSC